MDSGCRSGSGERSQGIRSSTRKRSHCTLRQHYLGLISKADLHTTVGLQWNKPTGIQRRLSTDIHPSSAPDYGLATLGSGYWTENGKHIKQMVVKREGRQGKAIISRWQLGKWTFQPKCQTLLKILRWIPPSFNVWCIPIEISWTSYLYLLLRWKWIPLCKNTHSTPVNI